MQAHKTNLDVYPAFSIPFSFYSVAEIDLCVSYTITRAWTACSMVPGYEAAAGYLHNGISGKPLLEIMHIILGVNEFWKYINSLQ